MGLGLGLGLGSRGLAAFRVSCGDRVHRPGSFSLRAPLLARLLPGVPALRGGRAWYAGLVAALLLVAAPWPMSAQQPSVAEPVRMAIAERWGVDPAALRLEWSSADDAASAGTGASIHLLAGGTDGVWYVDVEGEAGGTARLRVRAGMEAVEAVAARDLERGVALEADDIASEPAVRWGPPARAEETVEPGWVTHRRIRLGEPLRSPAVAPAVAVKAGDAVRIVYTRGPVELVLAGKAAGSGRVGERVAVRTEMGKRLEGTIVAPGTVRIENSAAARR